jgi:hypothetical protein
MRKLARALPDKLSFLAKEAKVLGPNDIIVFANEAKMLLDSVIVVAVHPEVRVAEWKQPRGVILRPLSRALEARGGLTPYLFRSYEIDPLIGKP